MNDPHMTQMFADFEFFRLGWRKQEIGVYLRHMRINFKKLRFVETFASQG